MYDTSVVDRYVAKISESICDNSPLVRRNACTLLTQIIAEDFIKWKPLLLFRFLFALTDTCSTVVKAAQYALCTILPRKNPTLLFNHVIETIFVLNKCTSHPSYNNYMQTERELSLFTCAGSERNQVLRRFQIYSFLLKQLTIEQLLEIHAKLHTEVLAMFAEESIPIHADVLIDILSMLSWQDFKFRSTNNGSSIYSAASTQDADLGNDSVSVQMSNVRGKFIGAVLKRHVSDNVVPIIVELKRTLEKQRSPLLRQVMLYLQLIMTEYKSEITDFLSQDPQLAKEIEFDMKRLLSQLASNRRSSTKLPL